MAQKNRKIESNSLSVGELLKKPFFYRVPVYQRDFAWTAEQINILWQDITSSLKEDRQEYFLGAIVVSSVDDYKRREIIDGQQRLTALSMIFSAVSNTWKSLSDEKRANGVFRDYLGSEERRTSEIVSKLTLNETNDPIYQKLVLEGKKYSSNEKKPLAASNKLLIDAFDSIKDKLQIWLKEFDDVQAALFDLEEFIANNTNIILIEAGDESDAFVIFETLNDRGLDLAVSDLVKNYLFSLADTHLEKFKKDWAEILLLVDNQNITQFLRHFWLSEYELVRERDLYRAIRNTIKGRTGARQFMERIRKSANYYAALTNPENSYWNDFQAEPRSYLEALQLFKVIQYRPVALAAMDKMDANTITQLLRALMVISFRYSIISSSNPATLEQIYSNVASAINRKPTVGIKEIFNNYLKAVYITDESFVEDFKQKRFNKDDIARYVLRQINNYLETDKEHITAELTLEHILPKNPAGNWAGAVPKGQEIADYVELIGNLTLLEKGRNRGIGNANFQEKKVKALSLSNMEINKMLITNSQWTYSDIISIISIKRGSLQSVRVFPKLEAVI